MKSFFLPPLLIFVLMFTSMDTYAQMFSVEDNSKTRANPYAPYLRVGVQPVEFIFKGNPDVLNSSGSLAFSGAAAHVAFEAGGFNLGVSLANDLTGVKNRNYFDLGISFTNPFYIIKNQYFGMGVPVKLSSKLTVVRSDGIDTDFSQTKLNAGAGGFLSFSAPEKLNILAEFIPSYGFSTASGGLIGGNVFSMRGKARINLLNLIFGRNISLGYDYLNDSYDIDGDEYDYDFTGHLITIGVSF